MDLVFYPKDELFCTRFRRTHYHFARNPTKISGSLELVGNLMKSYESNLFVLLHGLLSQFTHFMSFSRLIYKNLRACSITRRCV